MLKIPKNNRKKYLLIDVEATTQAGNSLPLVYDIGALVVDKHNNIYQAESWLIADIFLGERELMEKAYYSNKISSYYDKLSNKEIQMQSLEFAQKEITKMIKEYEIENFIAYNAPYDYKALNSTLNFITKGKKTQFLPENINVGCIMQMAKNTIGKEEGYKNFCLENGYTTKKGNLRYTAEIIYRFITGNTEFTEEHTGLADAIIEKEIFYWVCRKKAAILKYFKTQEEMKGE